MMGRGVWLFLHGFSSPGPRVRLYLLKHCTAFQRPLNDQVGKPSAPHGAQWPNAYRNLYVELMVSKTSSLSQGWSIL